MLFVRRGNDMVPTPRAESLAEPVRTALREIQRVFQSAKTFDPAELERTFTLMGADFFSMLLMPFLAARIAGVAPRVSFRFLDSARGDVSRLLQEDEIDAALERPLEVSDWVSSTPLFHSPSLRRGTMPRSDRPGSRMASACRWSFSASCLTFFVPSTVRCRAPPTRRSPSSGSRVG